MKYGFIQGTRRASHLVVPYFGLLLKKLCFCIVVLYKGCGIKELANRIIRKRIKKDSKYF